VNLHKEDFFSSSMAQMSFSLLYVYVVKIIFSHNYFEDGGKCVRVGVWMCGNLSCASFRSSGRNLKYGKDKKSAGLGKAW
jgi:hypothetical protein